MKAGVGFKTLSTKPAQYLPWLKKELDARGVKFVQRHVWSIEEAAAIGGSESIVINATALGNMIRFFSSCCHSHGSTLGAKSLLGVEDQDVYPIRGQTIIVSAPNAKECVSDFGGNRRSLIGR